MSDNIYYFIAGAITGAVLTNLIWYAWIVYFERPRNRPIQNPMLGTPADHRPWQTDDPDFGR